MFFNFVLPVSGTICTTSAKDVQIVPLTGKTKLVAQVRLVVSLVPQLNIVHNKPKLVAQLAPTTCATNAESG